MYVCVVVNVFGDLYKQYTHETLVLNKQKFSLKQNIF